MRKQNKQAFRWIVWVVWMFLIAILTSLPSSSFPTLNIPHLDKAVHAILYSGLGWFTASAWQLEKRRILLPWFAWLFCVLYGVVDELHQALIPGRSTEMLDLIVDAGAAAVAIFFYQHRARKQRGRNRQHGE